MKEALKSKLKLILDFLPLVIFFIAYIKFGLIAAIMPLIVSTLICSAIYYFLLKELPITSIIAAVLVTLMGGLTIYFQDEYFIKVKPTLLNLLFALILYAGHVFNRPFIKYLMGKTIQLTEVGWRLVTVRWIYLFIFLAILNEIVWRTQSTDFWVKFKVFGILPIILVFTFFQIPLIQKHLIEKKESNGS